MNTDATGGHAKRAEASAGIDAIESILAANRAALDHTLSELEQRVSAEGFFQEVMERLRNGGSVEFLRGLRDSVVHNPLPVTLAAIGLAWTAFADNSARTGTAGAASDVQGKTAGAAHRLDEMKARGREWAGRGGEALGSAREQATERGWRSVEQTRDFARDYPIIAAGMGLALGAALAALLPATQFENERLEPARDRAMDEAHGAVAAAAKGAKRGVKEESAGSGGTGEDRAQRPGGGDGASGGSPSMRAP